MFHCQMVIGPQGAELMSPGTEPGAIVGQAPPAFIPDFVNRDDWRKEGRDVGCFDDIYKNVCFNRDAHFPRIRRTIADLKARHAGKTFVIICPGPSLARTQFPILTEEQGDGLVFMSINRAIKYHPLREHKDVAYITERNAKPDWLTGPSGLPVPWAGACDLVTSPDASGWLADYWPDGKRFYLLMSWGEFPADPREECFTRDEAVFCYVLSPVMALDACRLMGAAKVVFVGADFSMTVEGHYYPDVMAWEHNNRHDQHAMYVQGINGEIVTTNADLLVRRNAMEACIYWIERSARIPVLNASAGGILEWRPTQIEEALLGSHKPIVDYCTGRIAEDPPSGNLSQRVA